MRRFFQKLGLQLLIVVFSLLALTGVNKVIFNWSSTFELDKNVNKVVLGDSHSRYSFNDKIISNSHNLSASADSYFYSYLKLKKIKKENPQIDTVFLSFSQHNVHKFIEETWLFDDAHLGSRLRIYFPFLGQDDFAFLFKEKPKKMLSGMFSQALFPVFVLRGLDSFGGYEKLDYTILDKELEKLRNEGRVEYDSFLESPVEKKYLQQIVNFCRDNDLELILVNPPIHNSLHDKQDGMYGFYEKYFSSVPFYDFSKMDMEDGYFVDLVHLSPTGADYFSTLFESGELLKFKY
ncbi:hypothetical protein ACOKFD_01450 [Flagellimonas sp. S174]|uniref:hypothetical protein n=1 Tax=Flagellimonas sp. S174 TaxID=3410790 RepID=UPI002610096B|nr:hypothetical protein [uncultured Allomuricauda sp.]